MKAILEFDLPEDQDLLKWSMRGSEYHSALMAIREDLRRRRKNLDGREYEIMDEVYEFVCELTSEVGVD
jgi:hypothetical protein